MKLSDIFINTISEEGVLNINASKGNEQLKGNTITDIADINLTFLIGSKEGAAPPQKEVKIKMSSNEIKYIDKKMTAKLRNNKKKIQTNTDQEIIGDPIIISNPLQFMIDIKEKLSAAWKVEGIIPKDIKQYVSTKLLPFTIESSNLSGPLVIDNNTEFTLTQEEKTQGEKRIYIKVTDKRVKFSKIIIDAINKLPIDLNEELDKDFWKGGKKNLFLS